MIRVKLMHHPRKIAVLISSFEESSTFVAYRHRGNEVLARVVAITFTWYEQGILIERVISKIALQIHLSLPYQAAYILRTKFDSSLVF